MSSTPATVACGACGALNAADFQRCIRCNQALDGAAPAEKAKRPVPAQREPARRRAAPIQVGGERVLGRWDASQLPATKLLLLLNFGVFLLHIAMQMQRSPSISGLLLGGRLDADTLALVFRFGAMPPALIADGQEPYRLLSACFVHFGILHVGMNMFALVHLSRLAEPALGSVRYLIAYVASGIIGFMVSVAWFMVAGDNAITAGASGAVFGVMGMVLGFLWRRRDPRWKVWFGQVVVYSLAFTLLLGNINHAAHLGGLLSGAAFGALFAKGAPKPSLPWQRLLAWACIIACVGSLVASQMSPHVALLERRAAEEALQ